MTEASADGRGASVSQPEELTKFLEAIFADGIVEPREREDLSAFSKTLPHAQVREVFVAFLLAKWGEVAADDIITGQERALMGKVIHELDLELSELPLQAQVLLKDHV